MLNKLKQRVKELLEAKTVGVFIGYAKGDNQKIARPVYITAPEEAEKLAWTNGDETTLPMLAKYLLKPEAKVFGKRGIIANPSGVKAIVGLVQEKQIDRSEIYIIAVNNGDPMPQYCDESIDAHPTTHNTQPTTQDEIIADLMKKSPAERWAFWKKELSKCIKCYACRQICPLCYCRTCIADKNQPQWIPTSPHFKGNFSWNIIRAYHLAGRCIDCGECERACPVGIPLMLLNKMISNNIKNNFGYEAGFKPDVPPPLSTYHEQDKENFII